MISGLVIPALIALANASPADHMISGDWVIKLVGALFAGAALVLGRYWGRKESEATRTRLDEPVPEIPTRKVYTPPSWDAHRALCDRVGRIEADLARIQEEMKEDRQSASQQYLALMAAGNERELRITEKIEGFARAIHGRIDDYLKPHPNRRQG